MSKEVMREALAEQPAQHEYWEEQPDGSLIPVDPVEMQPAQQQELVARIAELEETVRNLNHALREATEAPTLMGEPVSAKPVASIKGVDEYGPMLNWYKHWVNFPVGTRLYTTPQAQRKPLTPEWIKAVISEGQTLTVDSDYAAFVWLVRKVEDAHNIKEQP